MFASSQIIGLRLCTLLVGCAASAIAFSQTPAQRSQTGEDRGLEEIVVTARKRDESLQDVPISIVTTAGEDLRKNGVQRMESFATSVPNLQYSLQPSANDSIHIRGIGSAVNFGFETAVGLVVDGFYYGKTKIGRAAFLDLERIEVLRGPQGAILGKNNSAGAINLTTAKPTDDFEGMASVTANFEGDEGFSTEALLSGPLTETLKGRIAVRHDGYDGYIDNLQFGEPEQERDDWTGRATLTWEPNDNINVLGTYQRVDFTRHGHGRELYVCGPGKSAQLSAPGLPADDCELNSVKSAASYVNGVTQRDRFTQELDMAHLAINADLGGHRLTSLTGFMRYDTLDVFDSDNTPTLDQQIIIPEKYDQLLQELRLGGTRGRFDYTIGLFFLTTDQDDEFHFILLPLSLDLVVAGTQEATTRAAFGEVTFGFTDSIDLTVGGRYTHERKELDQNHHFAIPFTDTEILRVYTVSPSREENNFSPNLDLRWRPTENAMFYGSVRTGFRGGGFDRFLFAPDQATADATIEFDEEDVTAFEVGTKLELRDGTVRLNVALFRSEYEDLQVASFVTETQFRVDNAATAVSQGVEVDLDWQPTDSFLLNAKFAALDAEFDSFPNAQCYTGQTLEQGCRPGTLGQDLSGKPLPFAPDFQASVGASYKWQLGSNLRLTLFGQVNHSSGMFLGGDLHPAKEQDSYQLVNGRVTLSSASETWELSVIGRNLTDEEVMTATNNSSPDGIDAYLMEPRVLGIQGTFRF